MKDAFIQPKKSRYAYFVAIIARIYPPAFLARPARSLQGFALALCINVLKH